jgi:PAS domain S-box-containing protein
VRDPRGAAQEPSRASDDGASTFAHLVGLLDSFPHAVMFWGRGAECLFVNAAAASAFGRRPEHMVGLSMEELWGPHTTRLLQRHVAEALLGSVREHERALFDGHGELRIHQTTYTPVTLGAPVVGFSLLLVDITTELRTQAEVARHSEAVARLAARKRAMAPVGTAVLERLRHALGELESPGASLARIAGDISESIRRLRDLPAASEPPPAESVPGHEGPYLLVEQEDGGPVAPPREDAEPADVDSRARCSAEVFDALVDQLPVVITEWDPSLRLRFANRAAAEFAQRLGRRAVPGRPVSEMVDEHFLRAHQEFAERALGGEVQSFHRQQLGRDGRTRHFQVRYVPRLEGGAVIGCYAYGTDITARIEAADELTSARAAHAALQERQAVEHRLHTTLLQELFAANLFIEIAEREDGRDGAARIEKARAYLRPAVEDLAALLEVDTSSRQSAS